MFEVVLRIIQLSIVQDYLSIKYFGSAWIVMIIMLYIIATGSYRGFIPVIMTDPI